MKSTQSEIKPIKIAKRFGTTYCFECKDYTHSFRSDKVKMTNKILPRQKSQCCFLIKYVEIYKTKNKLTAKIKKIR